MSKQFDVVVIGGGPGGYIAAIRAAQLGHEHSLHRRVEERQGRSQPWAAPAPTSAASRPRRCCSPASTTSSSTTSFADHGITADNVKIDVAKMLARKDQVVKQNNDGIVYLFKKNKVTFFHGRGSFVAAKEGGYELKAGEETIFKPSRSSSPPVPTLARCPACRSMKRPSCPTTARCASAATPKKLGLIGAGVIGLGDGLGLAPPGCRSDRA